MSRTANLINRMSRIKRPGDIRLVPIVGNPEAGRLRVPMASPREAMIEGCYYAAAAEEETADFHRRMKRIARECGAAIVVLGHSQNARTSRWAGDKPLWPVEGEG